MRISHLAAAAAVLLASGANPTQAAPAAPANWLVYRVDVHGRPGTPATIEVTFTSREERPAHAPRLHLTGTRRANGPWSAMLVEDGRDMAAADVTGPVSHSVRLEQSEDVGDVAKRVVPDNPYVRVSDDPWSGTFRVAHATNGFAGQSFLLLFATPAGRFTGVPSFDVDGPATATLVARGAGAGYLAARYGGASGAAAGIGGVGPVRVTQQHAAGATTVFALGVSNCQFGACAWRGTTPDGRTTRLDVPMERPGRVTGEAWVTGPAGQWTWSLDAAAYAGHALAAYVPVGDLPR